MCRILSCTNCAFWCSCIAKYTYCSSHLCHLCHLYSQCACAGQEGHQSKCKGCVSICSQGRDKLAVWLRQDYICDFRIRRVRTKWSLRLTILRQFPVVRTASILRAVVYTYLTKCEQTRVSIHLGTMRSGLRTRVRQGVSKGRMRTSGVALPSPNSASRSSVWAAHLTQCICVGTQFRCIEARMQQSYQIATRAVFTGIYTVIITTSNSIVQVLKLTLIKKLTQLFIITDMGCSKPATAYPVSEKSCTSAT